MHLAHPLGVAAGEVVVHRDHVNAAAGESIEIAGQGGNQGLALAGFHLGDLTFVQHHAADQLHIKVTHAKHTLAGLSYDRKGFRQDLVKDRALVVQASGVGKPLLEGSRFATQFVVGKRVKFLLQQVDIGNDRLVALQLAGIGITQQELEHDDS